MAKIDYHQYIIAIGASAGGIEAISDFFDHTPIDAVSYILIQHLSANFKSQMAHILAPHSKLQIIEVTDNIQIETNKVYLIPSAKFMTVKNGRLLLTDKKNKKPPHLTIDHFFSSLADDCGEKAIGIILSGTGHDGSKGIEAIKNSGGMVIVQDPETAAFNGMPLSACRTGYTDFVLSPRDMPQAIEDYVRNGKPKIGNKNGQMNEHELAGIFNLIKINSPFDFTDYKRPTLLRRIKRRMLEHNFSNAGNYYNFLQNNPLEVELLANDFLISVTSFFRDPEAFKIIEETIIPAIMAQSGKDEIIKIWVPGCATGEEAFSIAILIKEYLNKNLPDRIIKIYATDINKSALAIASKGIYPDSIAQTITRERLESFFIKVGKTFKVHHDIRKMIVFAQHDLVKSVPYCNLNLISCRNLLIYMNFDLQEKAFSLMHFGLKKDGYLFLGPSENTESLKIDFQEISIRWNIYKNINTGKPVKYNTFSSSVMENVTTKMEVIKKTTNVKTKSASSDEFNLAILEESGFNGVYTDEYLTVIRSFGDTTPYLKNENFNFNLNDLMPDDISIPFKAAAHKALKLNERMELNGLEFERAGLVNIRLANIVIKPFINIKSAEKFLLILFIENKSNPRNTKIIKHAGFSALAKEHLINLEQELAESKINLEAAKEQSKTSDENMQSFNEEQQSANEEMQSANEELQSVNEELHTINKEYQAANTQLTELNDDLNNYFRSNINGQLFVNRDLLLKKYSPGAVKHINIRESDIGRPLGNITTNIKFETLIDDIKQVMLDGNTITREAEASNGNIYQVMTMPYIRKNSKESDGAVISFYDITELKEVSRELDITNKKLNKTNEEITIVNTQLNDRNDQLNNSKKYIEEIFNTIHDPLVILDKELKVIRATDGFYQTFKVTEEETEGNFLYDLGNKQWDIPVLRHQLEKILPEQGSFKAFEVNHVFNSIGHKIMRLTARQFDTHTSETLTLLAIHDLTDKRKVEEGLAEVERLLAESKERLHFAIESAGIGSWDFNVYTKELIWDNRCRELYGVSPEDHVDYSVFLDQLHPDDRDLTNDAVNRALKGINNGEFNVEYRSVGLHDQKMRWIKSKGKAYFNEGKKATRFIGTVLDISIEKSLEQSTRELMMKKDEFISIASHELKTPVTSLKLSLQLLNRMKENPSAAMFPRLIDQSNRSMEKITSLIDDLLNATQMSEGQLTLNKIPFTVATMLAQCCTHIREQNEYEIIIEGDTDLQINADEHRIEQVVVNFVNNAVKYAPDSKVIYLIIEKEENLVKIAVKDSGPGISSDKLSHLFDRYYRSDYQGKQYSGLGLGLYISSEIIKRHGGEIGVDSKLGEGATFWFKIPIQQI